MEYTLIGNHKKIEKVQMRATKQIHELKGLTYRQRLERLKLPTLKYCGVRGDMIEIYKMLITIIITIFIQRLIHRMLVYNGITQV